MTHLAHPLVGRDRELEALDGHLAQTWAGTQRFVFVTGEPGIGKTRLLLELEQRAERLGALTLRGRGSEFERALPFGLLVDALDEYLESLDPLSFSRLPAEDLRELAAVFPALRSHDPGSGGPTTPAERFRAHRAVRDVLERLAAAQPVVLILDDLHWADEATVELVAYLMRHPPRAAVMLAASFRDGQADRVLMTAIERAASERGLVGRIGLLPLSRAEAGVLVETGDADRLYAASGGNPFYLLELSRMPGGADTGGPAEGVPGAIAAAIESELDALSSDGRRLARCAAVTGDPFELDLAIATAGIDEAAACTALDDLSGHDLVRPDAVPRRFHFRHPLVRRAVYQACPPGARLTAHRRSADALAARGAPAAARAHHVEHAARPGDLGAVAVLREAGQATADRAPGSAARWFSIALGLMPDEAPAAERVELLLSLSRARAATGRFEDGRAALIECLALTGDDTAQHLTLVGACAGFEQLLGHHEAANTRLTAALARVPDGAAAQAAALMLQLAGGDFYRMDYGAMQEWGARALAAARSLNDPPLVAASLGVLAVAAAFAGAVPAAITHSADAAALVDAMPDDQLARRLDALANLATAELYLHRYPVAGRHARRGLAIARATGQVEMSPVLVPVLSNVLHVTGRVAESEDLLDGAIEVARLSGNAQALGWNLLSRAFTAVAAGDLPAALDAAEESAEVTGALDDSLVATYAGVALATALSESGEPVRAIDVLLVAAGGEELPRIAGGWRAGYFELLTRCWLAVGEPAAAERAAGRAAAVAAELDLTFATAMARRAAAAVAMHRGDALAAAEHALAAAAAADATGARIEAARARTLAGRALGRAGRRERAVAELRRAAEQLGACGAARYRQEAERDLRRLGHRVHRRARPGKPDGSAIATLTQREAEVARLLLDRRTNPEIATELFLSVKTIEAHLRSIFRKLDVASRYDVARVLERAGAPAPSRHAPDAG